MKLAVLLQLTEKKKIECAREYVCMFVCTAIFMHFNGTIEINKYQNKGSYGYGMFLVFLSFALSLSLSALFCIRYCISLYMLFRCEKTNSPRYSLSENRDDHRLKDTHTYTSDYIQSIRKTVRNIFHDQMKNKSKHQRHITFARISVCSKKKCGERIQTQTHSHAYATL